MADNKKSFILYCDYIHMFKKMPDELAGKLIKHVLEYVNDSNPTTDELMVDILFEPIKQQLKRDLKKYEKTQERNKTNGSKGGRPKKPTETENNPVGLINNPNNPQKPDTVTDTVTDTDNGTDTVDDNDISIKKIENKVLKIISRFKETNYDQNLRKYKTSKDVVTEHLERFLEMRKDSEDFRNKPYGSVILWFWNWCKETPPKEVVTKSINSSPWITKKQ